MISERKFSKSFTSFWNELLPTADLFVRRLNLSCDRFCLPLESGLPVDRDRRAIINELAFRFFLKLAKGEKLSKREKIELCVEVSNYIRRLAPNIKEIKPISQKELDEANELAGSLSQYFFLGDFKEIKFWPLFKGCGRLHACSGDILYKGNLVEVKAGDRTFRVIDIRQIITYLSLNFVSQQHHIHKIALVNPRTGLSFETSVDILIEDCSRRKPVDVFGDIVDFISTEVISA